MDRWRFVLLMVILHVGACRPSICPEAKRVEADYRGECLAGLIYHESSADVTISPRPQCPWERLVDLSIFDGFRPGITIKEAREQFGSPDIELKRGSGRFWRYQRLQGVIQIGHEDQGSGIIPFYYWWTLSALPKDPSIEAFFSPEVVASLPRHKEFYEVFVLNQCGLPMLVASIEKGKVKAVNWTNNPGSYHATGT